MLKLEKVAKTRELNVILRDKPSLLNQTFLLALGYALLCHIFAVVIFQISPFKIGYEASIIAPVHVASDFLSDPNQKVSIQYDELSLVPDYLPVPKLKPPKLPAMTYKNEILTKITIKHTEPSKNAFLALEDKLEMQPLVNLFQENTINADPISLSLSGSIANQHLSNDIDILYSKIKRFGTENYSLKSKTPYHFDFAVMIDQSQGEIFWWESRHEITNPKLRWLIESLLKDLRFEKAPFYNVEKGNIEITIHL